MRLGVILVVMIIRLIRVPSNHRTFSADKERKMSTSNTATSSGITLGAAIAVVLSYSANKSILWMMLHGIFSWFYVIYHAIKY